MVLMGRGSRDREERDLEEGRHQEKMVAPREVVALGVTAQKAEEAEEATHTHLSSARTASSSFRRL